MQRWDIINHLVKVFGYKRYLEIGIWDVNNNFNKINVPIKHGVDPNAQCSYVMTSDEFFELIKNEGKIYDIIFIDGLHTDEQVTKDIHNSLKHLADNGTIVCHDCLPTDSRCAREQHGGDEYAWFGTCWRAIARLRCTNPDLEIRTVDADCGCAIIRRGKQELFNNATLDDCLNFDYFEQNRNELMNVILEDEFYLLFNK